VDRPNGQPLAGSAARVGHWNSVFTRFRDWVRADIWKRLFDAVSDDPDMEYTMVDATIVKVHRHGQGAKGGPKPSDRPFERWHDTKILALTDALGNLVRFVLLPGQRFDTVVTDWPSTR
jgi:transposase